MTQIGLSKGVVVCQIRSKLSNNKNSSIYHIAYCFPLFITSFTHHPPITSKTWSRHVLFVSVLPWLLFSFTPNTHKITIINCLIIQILRFYTNNIYLHTQISYDHDSAICNQRQLLNRFSSTFGLNRSSLVNMLEYTPFYLVFHV